MSTSHRTDRTPPRQPDRPGPGGTRPNLLATWGGFGIGTFVGGLAAVIAAVVIHDHAAYPNSLCNTGLGVLGQAFSNTAQTDCSMAGLAEGTVGWLVFLGVAAVIVGLAKMGLGLAGGLAASAQAPGLKRPGAARPASTQAAQPAATQAPYEAVPPLSPPGSVRPSWPDA